VRGLRGQRSLAFGSAFALVLLYALRRGSYDVVPRQEQAIVVLWILVLGLALGILPRRRPSWLALLPLAGFGLLALLTALALTATSSDERTVTELARVVDHAALYALPLCALTRRTWTAAAAGTAAGVLAIAFLAVLARLAPDLVAGDTAARAFATNRLSYPLGYWNAMGAWSATAVAVGLAWSAHARSRLVSALALAVVPVALLALYLTYSRAGIASLLLGVLAVALVSRRRLVLLLHAAAAAGAGAAVVIVTRAHAPIADHTGTAGRGAVLLALGLAALIAGGWAALTHRVAMPRLEPRLARSAWAAAGLVVVVLAIAVGPGLARKAYDSYRHPVVASRSADPAARLSNLSGNRHDVWVSALDAYRSEPLSGIGPGTFEFWWNQHGTNAEFLHDAHNLYLESLAELGWPGLLVVLALLGSLGLAVLWARRRAGSTREVGALAGIAATVLIFAFSAGVDWMWESTANATLAFASAGIAAAALARGRGRPPVAARVVLVVVALLALAVQLPGLAGVTAVRRSQAAVRTGDPTRALAQAQDAIDAEPWAGSPYLQRALVLERARRFGAGLADARRAARREPQAYATRLVVSRLAAETGDARTARREYALARRLRPHSPLFAQPR